MKLSLVIVTCISLASALPQQLNSTNSTSTTTNSTFTIPPLVIANCQPGVAYCYEQIVKDLRASLIHVLPFTLLTFPKASTNNLYSTNTATSRSTTMRFHATRATNGRGRSSTAGTDRELGTQCSRVCMGRIIRSRSGVIGVRRGSASRWT
jgi:hypothetical protein